jgi:hypothetical protein
MNTDLHTHKHKYAHTYACSHKIYSIHLLSTDWNLTWRLPIILLGDDADTAGRILRPSNASAVTCRDSFIRKYYLIYIDRYWKEIFDRTIAGDAPSHCTNQAEPTVTFKDPFISYSALGQAHSIFQREFSTECELALPLSISSILSFP